MGGRRDMKVLIIDADPSFRTWAVATIRDMGLEPLVCENSWRAWRPIDQSQPGVILLGPTLQDNEREQFLGHAAELEKKPQSHPAQIVVALPQSVTAADQHRLIDLGAHDFLTLPCTKQQLRARIQMAAERQHALGDPNNTSALPEATEPAQVRASMNQCRAETRCRLALEKMPMLVMALDASGRIAAWNEKCERLTGFSAAEVVGRTSAYEKMFGMPGDGVAARFPGPEQGEQESKWKIVDRRGKRHTIEWSWQYHLQASSAGKTSPAEGTVWAIGRVVTTPTSSEVASSNLSLVSSPRSR